MAGIENPYSIGMTNTGKKCTAWEESLNDADGR